MKVRIEILVKADKAAVWTTWITPEDINQWNAASDDWHNPQSINYLRVGGKFSYRMEAKDGSMGFDFEGTYTKVIDNELIEYILGDGRTVSVEFIPVDNGIKVVETFDAEDENPVEMQRLGWQSILDNFGKYVESRV